MRVVKLLQFLRLPTARKPSEEACRPSKGISTAGEFRICRGHLFVDMRCLRLCQFRVLVLPVHNLLHRMSVAAGISNIPSHPCRPESRSIADDHLPPKAFLSLQRCLLARDGPACSIMSGTVLRCVQFLTKQTWLAGSRLSGFYVFTLPDCFFHKWLQILEIKIFMDPVVPILVLAAHDSKLSSTFIDETSAVAFQSRLFRQD